MGTEIKNLSKPLKMAGVAKIKVAAITATTHLSYN